MKKTIISTVFCLILIPLLQGQIDNHGPFSFYGIGRLQPVMLQGGDAMGGTYAGINDSSMLNILQPASLASLDLTQFQAGMEVQIGNREYGNRVYSESGVNLNHIFMGFPLVRKKKFAWGIGGGFQPFSYMGYDFRDTVPLVLETDTLQTLRRFNGEGGWNRVSISNGIRIGKSFFLGGGVHFNFGTVTRIRNLQFPSGSQILSSRVKQTLTTESFSADVAAQYKTRIPYNRYVARPDGKSDTLKRALTFTAGVVYSPGTDWKTESTETGILFSTGSIELGVDTFLLNPATMGNVHIPQKIAAGISIANPDFFTLSADVQYSQWSAFRYLGDAIPIFFDEIRVGTGVQVRPWNLKNRVNGLRFSENIILRTGLRYVSRSLRPNLQPIDEFGITFGFGLPVTHRYVRNINNTQIRRTGSFVNFGADISTGMPRAGTSGTDLFFRFVLGISVREWWFDRPLFN
jgi:hypothetical protein